MRKPCVRGYQAYLEANRKDLESRGLGFLRPSFATVKPKLLAVVEKGIWPPGGSFDTFYTLTGPYGKVDGCWVRLVGVVAEGEAGKGVNFGASILDLGFGYGQWSLPPGR